MIALAWMYLGVSCVSLVIQSWKLRTLVSGWPVTPTVAESLTHRGLLRTSMSRVAAAIAYVAIAVWTLRDPSAMTTLGLAVFTGVQLMWISNAFADVRMWSYLRHHTTPPRNGEAQSMTVGNEPAEPTTGDTHAKRDPEFRQ